jgi:hypothetical protein
MGASQWTRCCEAEDDNPNKTNTSIKNNHQIITANNNVPNNHIQNNNDGGPITTIPNREMNEGHIVSEVIRDQRWPSLSVPLLSNSDSVILNPSTPPIDGEDDPNLYDRGHLPSRKTSDMGGGGGDVQQQLQPPPPSGLTRLLRAAGQERSVRFAEPLLNNQQQYHQHQQQPSRGLTVSSLTPTWSQSPAGGVLALLTRAESITSQEQSPTFFFNSLTSTAPMSSSQEAGNGDSAFLS